MISNHETVRPVRVLIAMFTEKYARKMTVCLKVLQQLKVPTD
jgi:hypothetical protein